MDVRYGDSAEECPRSFSSIWGWRLSAPLPKSGLETGTLFKSLDGITDLMDMSLSELQELVIDRKAWLAAIHAAKSWTQLSDWTELNWYMSLRASLVAQSVKESAWNSKSAFSSWVGKIPWRRKWKPMPVFLPGKSHGQRSLAGHSTWLTKSQYDWNDLACKPLVTPLILISQS